MRLVLVMPTGVRVGYDDYFSSSPLGIETLAAHARAHADVALIDMRGRGHDIDAHADQLLAMQPDVLGISVNSAPHTNYALALAKALKHRQPDLLLLVGGQQATFLTHEMLTPGHIDAVIRGEGEFALCEILAAKGNYRGVAGVSWRDGDAIRNEPDRPLIQEIDTVLTPARELLADRSRYRMGAYRIEGVESSRGCPFACAFCSVRNFHRGKWRPKSVSRVMRDIDDVLARYSEPKVIYFADDNFCNDMERVEAICRAIVERRTKAYFWCQGRVDVLARNPAVVEWMGKAHFSAVLVGLETPNPRQLKESRKGISVEQMTRATELLHANDIGLWGTFILGLPGETREETEATGAFIGAADVDVAQITVATPVPGSDLYDKAKASGEIVEHNWDAYDFTSPTMKDQLPRADMDAIMHRAYSQVYLSKRFLLSLFSKRTNLSRLRRTALRTFASWIWILAKQGLRNWFTRLRRLGRAPAVVETPLPIPPAAAISESAPVDAAGE
ncbi:MAG: radical SAM protein [Phycisphaerae bacterium]|nr:radical SAM protein [Phycisphaerae bacterium]